MVIIYISQTLNTMVQVWYYPNLSLSHDEITQ